MAYYQSGLDPFQGLGLSIKSFHNFFSCCRVQRLLPWGIFFNFSLKSASNLLVLGNCDEDCCHRPMCRKSINLGHSTSAASTTFIRRSEFLAIHLDQYSTPLHTSIPSPRQYRSRPCCMENDVSLVFWPFKSSFIRHVISRLRNSKVRNLTQSRPQLCRSSLRRCSHMIHR